MDNTRGRSGSRGPATDARPTSRGPPTTTTAARSGSSGPSAVRRSGSSGPPRSAASSSSSPAQETAAVKRLRADLEWLFGDDNYPEDEALLLSTTGKDRWVPAAHVCSRLRCTEAELRTALRCPGSEGAGFFELQEAAGGGEEVTSASGPRIRRVPKLSKALRARALEVLKAVGTEKAAPAPAAVPRGGDGGGGGGSAGRLAKIRTQVEYYFGDDNLPFDYLTLKELDKNGSFPFSYVLSAPALLRMEVEEEEVCEALADSGRLRILTEGGVRRVKLSSPLKESLREVVFRTLQRGKENMGCLEVRRAKDLEEEFQKVLKQGKPKRKKAKEEERR